VGLDIDGEAASDYFGSSVALSSDGIVVAVGGSMNDGAGSDSGHVRVYENTGSAWVQLGSDIDGEETGDYSGGSVALSSDGTVIAIGGCLNDGVGAEAGHARVYQYSGSSWVQLGSDIDGEAAGDEFGFSIALSSDGTVVAVGGWKNDGVGTDAGHVVIDRGREYT
jgi:hypothetical protein